jgi:ACS family hexuronate transporter-like MFS transporter
MERRPTDPVRTNGVASVTVPTVDAAALRTIRRLRWYIVALVFAATAVSYIQRQTLSVVAPVLRDDLAISNFGYARIVFSFLLAYTIMQPVTGWLIDRTGTRLGFAVVLGWWSLAAMLHALAQGVGSFAVCRFLLGMGQAGSWAASVRAVSEWFPREERGFANGLWGAGTSVGTIGAVPLVAWTTVAFGWRMAFVITGTIGLAWLVVWLAFYGRLAATGVAPAGGDPAGGLPASSARPLTRTSYRSLLRSRSVWALVCARMFADPVQWFYNAWIPEYLARTAGFSMADIGRLAWIPFLANGAGIVAGGIASDRLCRRGRDVIAARLLVMFAGMLLMTAGVIAAAPMHIAVSVTAICVAVFGFGLWAPNMMSLCADAFPADRVGSVTGLTGIGAGFGGMAYTLFTGWALDRFGYTPVFATAGVFPLIAFAVLYALLDRRPRSTLTTAGGTP